MDLEDIRREYMLGGLRSYQLKSDPILQFELWLQQTIETKVHDPTAMILATVNSQGHPSQRIVLLKHVDQDGFVFFTNTQSRKAQDILNQSQVSLHFPWHVLERQVMVEGRAELLSRESVEEYFQTRPLESRLAAWASHQSEVIDSREQLMNQYEHARQAQVEDKTPDFWGGYRVVPDKVEFWQGGEHRLHDRFRYTRESESWQIERLSP